MIRLTDIDLSLFTHEIFKKLSVQIPSNRKIGVIGRNGAGKSTLLRLIAGEHKPDKGSLEMSCGLDVAYLSQNLVLSSDKSVLEQVLFQQCEEPYFYQKEAQQILATLGFSKQQYDMPVNKLSVGWRMRVALAKLLMSNADIYLFDEPTNHLDLASKEWFLSFLQQASFGYVLVSHDRYFLDHACEGIIDIENGKATFYEGNYTQALVQKEKRQEHIQLTYERQLKERARLQVTVARFKGKPSKAAMAKSIEKKIENMELVPPAPPLPTVNCVFPPVKRAGNQVLTFEALGYAHGAKRLFDQCSGYILRGKKVALVAPNGIGKTTFLNILAGKLPLQNGQYSWGHNVTTAYFQQDQAAYLPPDKTIFNYLSETVYTVDEQAIRNFLGNFLFPGEDVHKKISDLSGGEKNRVAMIQVLLAQANMLLLDEPTNHLDIYSKEVLMKAIERYQGTVLFVSHDQEFIYRMANVIFELTSSGIHYFEGTYEQYQFYKSHQNNIPDRKSVV